MSLAAQYVDGVLQTQTTSSESLSSNKKNGSTVSSDTFLSLLVAEMQNQDPLEPTSNTEWVSQYATFTQVEQISEMANSLDVMRANSLVGKEVIMKVTNSSTGEITYVRGPVDYIAMEEGKALLNINGSNYSMDDLDTVASPEYFEAYDLYNEFVSKVGALPSSIGSIDESYENVLGEIYDMCKDMTEYQTQYLQTYAPSELAYYKACLDKLKDLGISFEEEEEKKITLDDILNAFNEKMEALMTQVSEMTGKVAKLEESSAETAKAAKAAQSVAEQNAAQKKEEVNESENTSEDNQENAEESEENIAGILQDQPSEEPENNEENTESTDNTEEA